MSEAGNPVAGCDSAAPGSVLRAARTAQNLSLGEVARHLRLSVAQVEALEAGAFERLPGPVFVRGFIRNYARLLKMDPEPLLLDVAPVPRHEPDALETRTVRAEPLSPAVAPRWRWYAVAIAAAVAALAVYEFVLVEPTRTVLTRPPVAVSVPSAVTPLAKEAPAPVSQAPEGSVGAADRGPADAATETASTPTAVSGAQDSTPMAAGESEIWMTFERDSWVEIRDFSGRAIFSKLNRGGTEQRIRGKPPLVVVVGNARGVRLTYNDRAVDLGPYTRYDVARLTLQ